ncbi:MAG: MBL fold metallo-hydrolase [Burkholderiales bacterium]|nr:MBL fold metallo-hydrolase [Burkholderiales bacterium]
MMAKLKRHLILVAFFALVPLTQPGTAPSNWADAAGGPNTAKPGSTGFASKLGNVGETRTLEILPLVDWNTASLKLRGEAGVSYLVRTDKSTILFDVGGNLENSDPSPLVANMLQLGIKLADIDTIVISHNHPDHVGGQTSMFSRTFSLDSKPVDLRGKRVYVPIPMTYPDIEPVTVLEPMVIAPGVATIGPITGRINMGPVDEQALAIRVEGRGIVLIVGCGHQGLSNLLTRSTLLFEEPIYGVVGGLHYPIPQGRVIVAGVDIQRWATYGSDSGPTADDVQREIDLLARTGPQWVSLSPHDSSDEMIEVFRAKFGPRYHDLRVGEAQLIAGVKP